jgi:ATP-dependent Clp protease adapter protein ClpS
MRQPIDRPGSRRVPPNPFNRTSRQDESRRQMPVYWVVLHYDAANDLMFIVATVMELTRLGRAEAMHRMWQAYHSGTARLLSTYRERAELYAEQFHGKGLRVTIEPA